MTPSPVAADAAKTRAVAVHTLGCKVNQADTDALLAALAARGYAVSDFGAPEKGAVPHGGSACPGNTQNESVSLPGVSRCAKNKKHQGVSLVIVNTCAVTNIADRKSRQMIRRARTLYPGARVAACGCFAKLSPEAAQAAGADFVFNARDADRLVRWLEETESERGTPPVETEGAGVHKTARDADGLNRVPEEAKPPQETPFAGTLSPTRRVRAFLKIQEGCENFCAYCVVPFARGPVVSRPVAEVLAEARARAAAGTKEIVLTGVSVGAYKWEDAALPELIRRAAETPGLARLRLSSLDPAAVSETFLETARRTPKLAPHFHLSLQSGCDATLARMNRHYTAAQYRDAARALRAAKPDAALTTDVIVGFPGETDAHFEESLAFVEDLRFARVHVFEFSPKARTAAAVMPGQIPAGLKSERGRRMRALAKKLEQDYLGAHAGQTRTVLFETRKDGFWEGHTDNYLTVRVPDGGAPLYNEARTVRLEAAADGFLTGTLME